jgi:hypothetical protein
VGSEEARGGGCAFAGDVDEVYGLGRCGSRDCAGECKRVGMCDGFVFSVSRTIISYLLVISHGHGLTLSQPA